MLGHIPGLVAEVPAHAPVPVAALVRAAVAAEAVHGRAALAHRVQAKSPRICDGHQTLSMDLDVAARPAGGAGGAAVAVRRDRFGFDVDVRVGVDGESAALR